MSNLVCCNVPDYNHPKKAVPDGWADTRLPELGFIRATWGGFRVIYLAEDQNLTLIEIYTKSQKETEDKRHRQSYRPK